MRESSNLPGTWQGPCHRCYFSRGIQCPPPCKFYQNDSICINLIQPDSTYLWPSVHLEYTSKKKNAWNGARRTSSWYKASCKQYGHGQDDGIPLQPPVKICQDPSRSSWHNGLNALTSHAMPYHHPCTMCIYHVHTMCIYHVHTMCIYHVHIPCAYTMCIYHVHIPCAYTMCIYHVHIPCAFMYIYVYLCAFSCSRASSHAKISPTTQLLHAVWCNVLLKHILLAMPLSVSSFLIISHPNGVWERPKHTRVDVGRRRYLGRAAQRSRFKAKTMWLWQLLIHPIWTWHGVTA